MKHHEIATHLTVKMVEWLDTLPTKMGDAIRGDIVVAGGAIASLAAGETPNDYDVYFRTVDSTLEVAEYYLTEAKKRDLLHESPVVTAEDDRVTMLSTFQDQTPSPDGGFVPICGTRNAITLSDKIQLILRFVGEPSDLVKEFDFVHTTGYFMLESKEVVLSPEAEACIRDKILQYTGSAYPIASCYRAIKFVKRGWKLPPTQLLKILWEVNQLHLDDDCVVTDQLHGIDLEDLQRVLRAKKDRPPEYMNDFFNNL